jgi:hypothetical protein
MRNSGGVSADYILSFSYTDNDHKGDNATSFNISDAPKGQREKWRRMQTANRGTHNGAWRDQNRARAGDRSRVFDGVTSKLELTEHQREESRRLFMSEINHEEMGVRAELVAIAVCSVVVAVTDTVNYRADDRFMDLIEEYGFTRKAVSKCRKRVREHISPPYGTEEPPEWKACGADRMIADGGGGSYREEPAGQRWDFDVDR